MLAEMEPLYGLLQACSCLDSPATTPAASACVWAESSQCAACCPCRVPVSWLHGHVCCCMPCAQAMAEFKARVTSYLRRTGAQLSHLTLSRTPGLLAGFLALTGNLARLHLLAARMPYRQIVQLYTLVYCTVEVGVMDAEC